MFRSDDLPWLVQFFLMFYNDKPGTVMFSLKLFEQILFFGVKDSYLKAYCYTKFLFSVDWLLENLIQTKICKLDQDFKKCKKEKVMYMYSYDTVFF